MRLIDADALDAEMYRKSFEVDDGRNVWNSGLWIRYKIFEEAIRDAPTVYAVPLRYCKWIIRDNPPGETGWYIDTDAVYKIIKKAPIGNPLTDWEYGYTCAPTVDAVPVRHGKWIYGNEFHWYTASCNKCGYQRRTDIKADRWNQWNYCPNCGARMDGE